MVRLLAALVAVTAALSVASSGCGAGDDLPPPVVPPPARCAPVDTYLSDLYAAVDSGAAEGLAVVLRERFPESTRRDVIDALLRLLRAFEPGAISALAPAPDAPAPPGDLLGLVARVLRLLEGPPAREDVFGLGRRVLASCEGGPIFGVLADLASDTAFIDATLALLASPGLVDTLAGLDFQGEEGREALRYLVRNLLVTATQDSFSLETLTGLLGLLVDLDAPPWDALERGLSTVLAGEGLEATRLLLACIGRADPELVLGGFLYDLLVSGALTGAGDLLPPPSEGDASRPLLRVLAQALGWLSDDALTRRGFRDASIVLLASDNAPPALGGAASLIELGALGGVFDLVLDLVTGACRR